MTDARAIELRIRIRTLAEEFVGEALDVLVLFGSRARGDATPESDWDVLAMLKDDADATTTRSQLLHVTGRLAEELGEQVNFTCMRWQDAHQSAHLIKNAVRDGTRL